MQQNMAINEANIEVAGKCRDLHNNVIFESLTGEYMVQVLSNIEVEDGAIAITPKTRLMVKANIPDLCNLLVVVHVIDKKLQQVLCKGIQRKTKSSVKNSPLLDGKISSVLALDGHGGCSAELDFYFKELSYHHEGKSFALRISIIKEGRTIYAARTPFYKVQDRLRQFRGKQTESSTSASESCNKRKKEVKDNNSGRQGKKAILMDDRKSDVETEAENQDNGTFARTNNSITDYPISLSFDEEVVPVSVCNENSSQSHVTHILMDYNNNDKRLDDVLFQDTFNNKKYSPSLTLNECMNFDIEQDFDEE